MSKIYLISPPKIELENFSLRLQSVLKTGLVPLFQLRLKDCEKKEIFLAAKNLQKICADFGCKFILNDDYEMALELGASGVHLGAEDGSILQARKKLGENFLIGASCYDSKELAVKAQEQGANQVSFGAFFPTKTKITHAKPEAEILAWAKKNLTAQTVAIGGISAENCALLVKQNVDFLSVISCIWDHSAGERSAVILLSEAIKKAQSL